MAMAATHVIDAMPQRTKDPPPYGSTERKLFVPRKIEDFGDGGRRSTFGGMECTLIYVRFTRYPIHGSRGNLMKIWFCSLSFSLGW